MAWFAYISKECEVAAKKHNVFEEVKNLQQELEELQQDSLARFYQFPPPYLVRKKFAGKEGRLIAERREIQDGEDEHTVIVFLDFMTRGNSAYEGRNGFGNDPINYGNNHYQGIAPESELKKYIQEKIRNKEVCELKRPTEFEWHYLNAALQGNDSLQSDGFIYESDKWKESINKETHQNRLETIFRALPSFFSPPKSEYGYKIIPIPNNPELKALGFFFPKYKILFLAGLGDEKEINARQKQYTGLFEKTNEQNILNILAQSARHAYPAMVLAGELDFWSAIEKTDSGNMALSPEENQLLKGIEDSPDKAYPLFINGRAGSGKSTILQYLFSQYIEFHLKHLRTNKAGKTVLPPLYLTWSKPLLENASKNVKAFLKCSLKNLDKKNDLSDVDRVFSTAFRSFQNFMLELIPKEERSLFILDNDHHISYAIFVKKWTEKFHNEQNINKLGPEICWHIIRTFIKGCNIEGFLEPEDYQVGLKKEQTVEMETYKLVFDKVWTNWYRDLTVKGNEDAPGEFWDDQDLIRYVLRKGYCNKEYPVVFCDEAQDFTRIELNAILKLSLFSHRKIYSHEVPMLPFAFAGDPFQTLNPTGFRWEAIKNSFVEQFINSHHQKTNNALMPELNYWELTNNYRSAPAIVKFSNHVQQLRGKVMQMVIKPQMPWKEEKPGMVALFDMNNSLFWKWVKTNQDDIYFVVPCNRDCEEMFWEDSQMKNYLPFANATVMSTIAIKGLEHSTIVVCGFGDQLSEPLGPNRVQTLTDDKKKLSLEYFINKLYVAVSRAQNRLLILDTTEGINKLWTLFMNQNLPLLQGINQEEITLYEQLTPGRIDDLNKQNCDSFTAAEQLKTNGISQHDPYLMRRAGSIFSKNGMALEASICKALAFFLREEVP